MSGQCSSRVFCWNASATRKCRVSKSRPFHRNMVSSPQVLLGRSERCWVECLSKQERETARLDLSPRPHSAPLREKLSRPGEARLLRAVPAPRSWLGRVLSADNLFQIRPLFLPGDPRGDSHSWDSKQLCGIAGCHYFHLQLGDQRGTERLTWCGKCPVASLRSWQKMGVSLSCAFVTVLFLTGLGADAVKQLWGFFYLVGIQGDGWELIKLTQKTLPGLAGCPTAGGFCLAAVGNSICFLCSCQQPVLPGSHRLPPWWP